MNNVVSVFWLTLCILNNYYILCLIICWSCLTGSSFQEMNKADDKPRLIDHKRTQHGEKKYVCEVCGKRFTRKSNLNRHKLRHTGENVYTCCQCETWFSTKSGLYQHMNIHRSKYKCTECGKCCLSNTCLLYTSDAADE